MLGSSHDENARMRGRQRKAVQSSPSFSISYVVLAASLAKLGQLDKPKPLRSEFCNCAARIPLRSAVCWCKLHASLGCVSKGALLDCRNRCVDRSHSRRPERRPGHRMVQRLAQPGSVNSANLERVVRIRRARAWSECDNPESASLVARAVHNFV